MQKVELLSPARDLVVGKAAIDNGADAVYIGAPAFGARKLQPTVLKISGLWCVMPIVFIAGYSLP